MTAVDPRSVTAVVVTRGNVDLSEIKASLSCFGTTLIYDNSQERDMGVFGRYQWMLRNSGIVYTQDDDCVVADPLSFCDAYLPDTVTCNMPVDYAVRYSSLDGIALIGFGAICDADLARHAFEAYWLRFPDDALFRRECDRVFTALNRSMWIDRPMRMLDTATDRYRLYRQPEHQEALETIRSRIKAIDRPVLAAPARPTPLVSAVIIFLNAAHFLREAIESVIAQTYPAWELVLVDDGSSDSSTEIAIEYARAFPTCIRYIDHPGHRNLGKSASRILGVREAAGKYIAFLDADDVWLPHKLAQQVELLETRPMAGMVCGRSVRWFSWTGNPADVSDDQGEPVPSGGGALRLPPSLVVDTLGVDDWWPTPCGSLIRRDLLLRVGGGDVRFKTVYEHGVLFAKLFLAAPVWQSPEIVAKYRQHPNMGTAVAARTGQWHPHLPSRSHGAYVTWLDEYVRDQGIEDAALRSRLRMELRPYRSPRVWWVAHVLSSARGWLVERARNLRRRVARRIRRESTGLIQAHPNPLHVSKGARVRLSWHSEGAAELEVRVGSPGGQLFSRSGPSGFEDTGSWGRTGLTFYLQDVSDGRPLTEAHTLATVTMRLRLEVLPWLS